MKRSFPLFLALSLSTIPTAHAAPGIVSVKETKNFIDPAARALLERAANAYAALEGISMQFSTFDERDGKVSNSTGEISFTQPLVKILIKRGEESRTTVFDGRKLHMLSEPGRYSFTNMPRNEMEMVQIFSMIDNDFPLSLGYPFAVMSGGKNLLDVPMADWKSATLIPDNGVEISSLGPKVGIETFRLYFDPTDHLLRRVERTTEVGTTKTLNSTTVTSLKIDPEFASDTFVFTPPLQYQPGYVAPRYDTALKVGSPPYPLRGKDLNGKTHSWEQYAGKVVLLDFWATWCGPCVREIPNVLANYKKYHAQGFEIIGVSCDGDLKALERYMEAHSMKYPQLVTAKGKLSIDAEKYAIVGIPFSFLIGKDGNIAAIDPRGEKLEPALKAALAQK